jgi:hypothetical protein
MHAFNFSSTDIVEVTVDHKQFITDQQSYSKLKPGSVIQVRRIDTNRKAEKHGWMNDPKAHSTCAGEITTKSNKPNGEAFNSNDTNEAALALAALSGHFARESKYYWEKGSKLTTEPASVM